MKSRVKLLTLIVKITLILLSIGAVLVVIGIFNESLDWDIFGPKVEAFLWAAFGSSLALSAFGVAMTFVLGIQEIVKAFKLIVLNRRAEKQDAISEASPLKYVKSMILILILLTAIIGFFALVNYQVQKQRSKVFKRLIKEQMQNFSSKLEGLLTPIKEPPRNNVPQDIYAMIKTIDNLSYIQLATLYLPDSQDPSAMWGYTAWRDYKPEDGFARFFIAKDFEKAMKKALNGDAAVLETINNENDFTWYYLIRNNKNEPIAVIRIDANRNENFREYKLGK